MENTKELTGRPSKDKPWLRWYTREARELPACEDTSVYAYLVSQSRERLEHTAIRYFNNRYTFAALFAEVERIAGAFLHLGVKTGDIVTLSLPNIPENVICFYALNKIGAVANFIDLRLKGDKLIESINAANSRVIVATDLFASELDAVIQATSIEKVIIASPADSLPPFVKQIHLLQSKRVRMENTGWTSWKAFRKSGKSSAGGAPVRPFKKAPACILHTSGTTGTPKGVVLTNEIFLEMAAQIRACGLQYRPGDTFLSQVPPFLAYNIVSATNNPLTMGLEVIMLPDYQPEKFADNIYRHKPNHVIAGPADWRNFLENAKVPDRDYSFLQSMISGSDKIDPEQKKQIQECLAHCGCKGPILEGYGMTEIAAAAVINLPQHNVNESVGIPLPKVNVCIYDSENEREVGYGVPGEICMAGPTVMPGYYNAPEETANILKRHDDGILWLHSGDLGRIDQNGNVFLEGRLKRVIIGHDGMKVSPFDIEKVLLAHPLVTGCCVVGHGDPVHKNGKIAVAYVTVGPRAAMDETGVVSELQNHCAKNLQQRYRPREIHILDKLPLTANGKTDYRALEKQP